MAKVISQMAQGLNFWAPLVTKLMGSEMWKKPPQTNLLAEVPVKLTGLTAGIKNIKFDDFGNPYVVDEEGKYRVSSAVALVDEERKIIIFDRDKKSLENENPLPDIYGSRGFGVSAIFKKLPQKYWGLAVSSVELCDFIAIEMTDGQGDAECIIMPCYIVNVFGKFEGVLPENLGNDLTAKLDAIRQHLLKK